MWTNRSQTDTLGSTAKCCCAWQYQMRVSRHLSTSCPSWENRIPQIVLVLKDEKEERKSPKHKQEQLRDAGDWEMPSEGSSNLQYQTEKWPISASCMHNGAFKITNIKNNDVMLYWSRWENPLSTWSPIVGFVCSVSYNSAPLQLVRIQSLGFLMMKWAEPKSSD